MKEIKLNHKGKHKGEFVALVDDEDFERINKFKWMIQKDNTTKNYTKFYAITRDNIKKETISMHQMILGGKGVDHKDGDGLNNQRSNLRFCTQQQNCMNRRPVKNTSSIYKGVHFVSNGEKYRAKIKFNGRSMSLGCFISETDAAKAYDKKAVELFGEFAYLNFKT